MSSLLSPKSPPHPAWPHRPLLTVAVATERWVVGAGGATIPMTNMGGHQSASLYPGMAKPPVIQYSWLLLSKLWWVMFCMYWNAKDTALSPSWFDVLLSRPMSSGGGRNILQLQVKLEKYPPAITGYSAAAEMCRMTQLKQNFWPLQHNPVHSYIHISSHVLRMLKVKLHLLYIISHLWIENVQQRSWSVVSGTVFPHLLDQI